MEGYRHESNPNLCKLEDIIMKYLVRKGEQSRGIIFVKTRGLAEALSNWLNRCGKEEIMRLRATIFTGTNASESEGGMTQAQQDACVENFRKGDIRLLVATSVAEEGIDVPECNLVIKYNHVGNEISTIQTKGRSRKIEGRSILLAMSAIREKEIVNIERARMMIEAVRIIHNMPASERLPRIKAFQEKALQELELDEMMEQSAKRALKDKKFTMYCRMCRQIYVESEYVKTIYGSHRVVTDWNIWRYVNVNPIKVQYIDEVKMIGSVRCRAKVDKKGICHGPLGVLLIYREVFFLALGINNFVFVEEGETAIQTFKKWKMVKYLVEEIGLSDIKRYIGAFQSSTQALQKDLQKSQTAKTSDIVNTPSRTAAESPVTRSLVETSSSQSVHANVIQGAEGGYGIPFQHIKHSDPDTYPKISDSKSNNNSHDSEPGDVVADAKSQVGTGANTKSQAGASDISAYKSDDKHHQTKVVSMNTVAKNKEKHEMEKILDTAPSLSLSLDDQE